MNRKCIWWLMLLLLYAPITRAEQESRQAAVKPLFRPKVTIQERNIAQGGGAQPTAPASPQGVPPTTPVQPQVPGRVQGTIPPFQRRPVPAPIGDISVSTTTLKPDIVDLGTKERVPRLSLREAPVREVLAVVARVAGLNVAFADDVTGGGQQQGATGQQAATGVNARISLDVENESAQDVFNNILRLTNLDANRVGRTIFVAARLPVNLKNIVHRTYRLNQISVGEASAFLAGLGAERVVNRQRPIPGAQAAQIGAGGQTVTNIPTESIPVLESVQGTPSSILPLKGLQVVADERSNSLTLVGTPSLVEYAAAQLARIDTRRRQVAVNVKIVDVSLSGDQQSGSSFSFGINDSFFTVNDGVAVLNFGQLNPANNSGNTAAGNFSRPVVRNPVGGSPLFTDPNNLSFSRDPVTGAFIPDNASPFSPGDNPLAPAVRAGTGAPGNNNTYLLNPGGQINANIPTLRPEFRTGPYANTPFLLDPTTGEPVLATRGNAPVTFDPSSLTLPSIFQYPRQFLARLNATIATGNAKLLSDPTLLVQEGQQAQVDLGNEVITLNADGSGVTKDTAGLRLSVRVDRVDENGFINMAVLPQVSVLGQRRPVTIRRRGQGQDRGGEDVFVGEIDLLSKRALDSGPIRLRDGQSLILSGVIQDQDRESVSKVPFLGDLPIVGALFRNTRTEKTRSEVIIVVTPQIIDDSDRATWGYTYQPGPEVQRVLDKNNVPFR
ncbi:MAG: secretin N-terminal domain-containing protein [Pseudanabaenaceae cyanobacterium SKYGB_i_bin29]|nr:type II and III secretion system protein [Pseudanabaenaceae cyanobacterium SKYG29]MDW8421962.1 secretin N-terminal domain-containing protein [Pseudanabaenaceae cyanobacterium SKYGB_i_bin29]